MSLKYILSCYFFSPLDSPSHTENTQTPNYFVLGEMLDPSHLPPLAPTPGLGTAQSHSAWILLPRRATRCPTVSHALFHPLGPDSEAIFLEARLRKPASGAPFSVIVRDCACHLVRRLSQSSNCLSPSLTLRRGFLLRHRGPLGV